MTTVEVVEQGERRCLTCGKPHDCYRIDPRKPYKGVTWADPDDGHSYHQESWETVARRMGFERGK